MSDNYQINDYQLLLAEAARFYEKHEAGRPEPFNVFSVLRKETDEVNLHSRFLHALLDYKKSGDENRENVKDFLQHVGIENFDQTGIKVERERHYIDLLITNNAKQAVVIENKIGAGDQPEQLQRYYNTMKERGYGDIHLLYLTLDSRDPSENSVGGLDNERIITISYKNDLPSWLESCQKRACDEPELRESVAQYLQLVRKLTGTDFTGAYMKDLEKLLLRDNNLVLVPHLHEAMIKAKVSLLVDLWDKIDSALKAEISDLPSKDEEHENAVDKAKIERFLNNQRNAYHGLFYTFSRVASLGVEASSYGISFGIRWKNIGEEDNKIKEVLNEFSSKISNAWWPWQQNVDGDLNKDIELLSDEGKRKKYAKEIAHKIADDLEPIWKKIKQADLDK